MGISDRYVCQRLFSAMACLATSCCHFVVVSRTYCTFTQIFEKPDWPGIIIAHGISGMNDLKKVGRVGGKAIIYFEVVTTYALIIGIVVSHFIEPGRGVNTSAIEGGDISKFTQGAKEFSWLQFLKDNLTIQVLLFSIIVVS